MGPRAADDGSEGGAPRLEEFRPRQPTWERCLVPPDRRSNTEGARLENPRRGGDAILEVLFP
jgi:hypothetical protein